MLYSEEDIKKIRDLLLQYDETIAVAESVTSGHIQAALSSAQDASLFYQGGITVYNIHQKITHLHIDPVQALQCNCVSEKVAQEMSLGACRLFGSNFGIGITGYAAPLEEKPGMQLFAWYAVAHNGHVLHSDVILAETADPVAVQVYYVNTILAACPAIFRENITSSL